MRSFNETKTPIFVLLCVLCFQVQPLDILCDTFVIVAKTVDKICFLLYDYSQSKNSSFNSR